MNARNGNRSGSYGGYGGRDDRRGGGYGRNGGGGGDRPRGVCYAFRKEECNPGSTYRFLHEITA